MFEKISFVKERFKNLSDKLSDPEVIADNDLWKKLCKEYSDLSPIMQKNEEYEFIVDNIKKSSELLKDKNIDKEFKVMLEKEINEYENKIEILNSELKLLLIPKNIVDEKNVIIEIRSGTGGDEAALFVSALFRMYSMYAEKNRMVVEILNLNEIGIGGIKEVSFLLKGKNVYSKLKFESGVHRVQRVPETETNGRIHTSTVTVAVLPEAEDVEVNINVDDLEFDTFRASGAGGQHVNKTESAIRITHVPSGIVVSCQAERSQHKNRDCAMKMLRSKLYEMKQREQGEKIASNRKMQVGTGERSEKIRTYNFPQSRVTDHRINLTLYKIESIMNGDLDELIDTLIAYDQSEKLKAEN
ncbi:MAG: peptide chain release factor 1 [Clostridiales bacterium]|jgi:peptide chain release factor 1|nr:peptide chain release factor 1 [Clostridiales bacterium]